MHCREIGSEFWDVPIGNVNRWAFPSQTQWFLSGRGALLSIINELKKSQSVAVPSWCCDSVVRPFVDAGKEVHFYPVYWDGNLRQEIPLDADVLFVMDYFGYGTTQADLSGYEGVVIRDVTHSIFSANPAGADFYLGSLRKWCGIWTGGYAWSQDGRELAYEPGDDRGYVALRQRAMRLKENFLVTEHSQGTNETMPKEHLACFAQAEELLEALGMLPASARDIGLAQRLDAESIREKRRANAAVLREAFPEWLIFPDMAKGDCPLFVPVRVPRGQRNALRRFLIDERIYCPVHWPVSQYHQLTPKTQTLYDEELSLVCDQRYDVSDMHRIVEAIRRFMGEE